MKLSSQNKFFINNDNEYLILVTEIEIDQNMIKNNFITMKGTRFFVDYESNEIDKGKDEVIVSVSFDVEGIYEDDCNEF